MLKFMTAEQRKELISQLQTEMKKSAKELDYEKAAELRDEIQRLQSLE